MNQSNVDMVSASIAKAFGNIKLPSQMGIDILKHALDSNAVLSIENPKPQMLADFEDLTKQIRDQLLEQDDTLTNEEIDAGMAMLLGEAESFQKNGPTPEQAVMLQIHKMMEKDSDESNSTLH